MAISSAHTWRGVAPRVDRGTQPLPQYIRRAAVVAPTTAKRMSPSHGGGLLGIASAALVGGGALGLALAPVAALGVAIWACVAAISAVWRLAVLIQSGQALDSPQAPALLGALETAARAGFLSVGYLALIFALITLLAGLFGRGWGWLYIFPGAALTTVALGLLVAGVLIAQPLEGAIPIAPAWLVPLAVYTVADAILISALLVDTRLARARRVFVRRRTGRRAPRPATVGGRRMGGQAVSPVASPISL